MEKEPAEVMKPEPVQEPKTANVESTTATTAEPAASAGNDSDEGLFRLNTPKFESKSQGDREDRSERVESVYPSEEKRRRRNARKSGKTSARSSPVTKRGNSRVMGLSIKDRKTERQDQVLLSNREKAVRMQRKNVTVSRKTA